MIEARVTGLHKTPPSTSRLPYLVKNRRIAIAALIIAVILLAAVIKGK